MQKEINKREYHKLQLSDYEQTEKRKIYRNVRNQNRYQRLVYLGLPTDTGFDVICSSCLQYKNKSFCKPIQILSKETSRNFIVQDCALLKNRTAGQFVCNPCLNDIKKNKTPKRSHINKFKFGNFPRSFIQKLKQKCSFNECQSTTEFELDNENHERGALIQT